MCFSQYLPGNEPRAVLCCTIETMRLQNTVCLFHGWHYRLAKTQFPAARIQCWCQVYRVAKYLSAHFLLQGYFSFPIVLYVCKRGYCIFSRARIVFFINLLMMRCYFCHKGNDVFGPLPATMGDIPTRQRWRPRISQAEERERES